MGAATDPRRVKLSTEQFFLSISSSLEVMNPPSRGVHSDGIAGTILKRKLRSLQVLK